MADLVLQLTGDFEALTKVLEGCPLDFSEANASRNARLRSASTGGMFEHVILERGKKEPDLFPALASAFLEDHLVTLRDLLESPDVDSATLVIEWPVPEGGYDRTLKLPVNLLRVLAELQVEVSLMTFVVESFAGDG